MSLTPGGGKAAAIARNIALIVPLLLVNAAAIYGQVMWAQTHLLFVGILGAVGFACALESIGIFLAAEAHASLMAGDSSARLRLASYAVALLVGALNYAHFAPTLSKPTPQALAFGAMSVISPWLWSIRSRSMSRAQLREQGLIDGRAVKFAAIQWVMYPRWSFQAFRAAVWRGETNPDKARALIEPVPVVVELDPEPEPEPEPEDERTTPDLLPGRAFAYLTAAQTTVELPPAPAVTFPPVDPEAKARARAFFAAEIQALRDNRDIIDKVEAGELTAPEAFAAIADRTPSPLEPEPTAVPALSEPRSRVSAPIGPPPAPEPAEAPPAKPRPKTTAPRSKPGRIAGGTRVAASDDAKATAFIQSRIEAGHGLPSGPEIARAVGKGDNRKWGQRRRAAFAAANGIDA